jgi:thiosulfate/3-mercaptopyruvate sulfurtransferase
LDHISNSERANSFIITYICFMAASDSPLIQPKDIQLGQSIVIDARSGPGTFERYLKSHLQRAIYADLDKDLSSKPMDPAYGGRHPLPDIKDFTAVMGKFGITPQSHVVIYDDKSGANAAARLWWMLRAIGHERVQVVDGGFDAIIRDGLPMSTGTEDPKPAGNYPATTWLLPTVALDKVIDGAESKDFLVIDVRESYRYRGDAEPIDLVAGHIPGAINIPYLENLGTDGTFLPPENLAKLYIAAIAGRDPSNVIVHCGSGVTACHTLLALEHAGIKGANLYVGSWSEWSRRGLPISTVTNSC